MTISTTTEAPAATLTLDALREKRRRLLDEAPRVALWRRLAKARLDLAVADAMSEGTSDQLSAPAEHLQSSALRSVVLLGDRGSGCADMVSRLRRLDETERCLRVYDAEVRRQLEDTTRELVRRYNAEPSSCLTAVPRDA